MSQDKEKCKHNWIVYELKICYDEYSHARKLRVTSLICTACSKTKEIK